MYGLSLPRYRSLLLALLLLCLSWSAWLQAEHIHLDSHEVVEECLLYHQGANAALSSHIGLGGSFTSGQRLATYQPLAGKSAALYSPPARAPPFLLS
ncbi:hypothetical protein [Spongiibacter sp.]|uniref:hypothetical protein n=1 Tax=Spongiibacter sp. TaxID=2024860 RepID=UPI00356A2A60